MNEHCPVCDSPAVAVSEDREVQVGRRATVVRDEFLRCTQCDEEFYLPGQMDVVQTRASNRIREEEGLLRGEEIRTLRESLGLTQRAFERLIGVGPKTVVRWERGTVFQNGSADSLLRAMREFPEVSRFLAAEHGVQLQPVASRWGHILHREGAEAPQLVGFVQAPFRVRDTVAVEWSNIELRYDVKVPEDNEGPPVLVGAT